MKGEQGMAIAMLGIHLGKNTAGWRDWAMLAPSCFGDGVARQAGGVSRTRATVRGEDGGRCGAHHLGRVFAAQGHEVRLMAPEYVQPYVEAQKNDDRDAEAIAKAATRPTMRFVALKSEAQLDQQTLHRGGRGW
jgi:transposase